MSQVSKSAGVMNLGHLPWKELSFSISWYLGVEVGGGRRLGSSVHFSRTQTATFISWHMGLRQQQIDWQSRDGGNIQGQGNLAGSH